MPCEDRPNKLPTKHIPKKGAGVLFLKMVWPRAARKVPFFNISRNFHKNTYSGKRRSRAGGSTVLTCKTAQKSPISDSKCHRELDTPKRLTATPYATIGHTSGCRAAPGRGSLFQRKSKGAGPTPESFGTGLSTSGP